MVRIIETGDGSQSLYNPRLRETYHSTHGALTESRHVFIQMGLEYLQQRGESKINILEVGLGTGLNAMLTIQFARTQKNIDLDYYTLEPYPLTDQVLSNLTYADLLGYSEAAADFDIIHNCKWGEPYQALINFCFTKDKTRVESLALEKKFNLIFYDAFAPSKQLEVWRKSVLEVVYAHMNIGGILVTYCAKGQFKRDLVDLGFIIETMDGPPGKRRWLGQLKSFCEIVWLKNQFLG